MCRGRFIWVRKVAYHLLRILPSSISTLLFLVHNLSSFQFFWYVKGSCQGWYLASLRWQCWTSGVPSLTTFLLFSLNDVWSRTILFLSTKAPDYIQILVSLCFELVTSRFTLLCTSSFRLPTNYKVGSSCNLLCHL